MNTPALNRRQFVVKFSIGSIIVFLLSTFIAMLVYPGGTHTDPTTEGYTFFYNYLSDLGLITAYNGEPKWLSLVLFSGGLTLGGSTFIAFFTVMPKWFKDDKRTLLFARLGSGAGMFCAIGFLVVAATPADIFLGPHVAAVKIAMVGFLFACIFYGLAIFRRKDYPNLYAIVYGVFVVYLIYYLWLLFLGPSPDTNSGLVQQCVGQKILVYTMSLTIVVQCWGMLKIPENAATANDS